MLRIYNVSTGEVFETSGPKVAASMKKYLHNCYRHNPEDFAPGFLVVESTDFRLCDYFRDLIDRTLQPARRPE